MTEFSALSQPQEDRLDVPMFKTLSAVTTKMLQGFEGIGLFDRMEEKGLGDLLTYQLNHIQAGVQSAVGFAKGGDQNAFLGAMNLIQADIANLVALAEPFGQEDFNTVMKGVAGYSKVLETRGIEPEFMLKNSGMRGLSSVISGLENMRGREGPLQIAVLENSYYESQINLGHAKGNTTHTVSDTNHGQSIIGIGEALGESGAKLDLFVAEFHHNIGMGVSEYADLNVLGQVKSLIQNDLVSDRFTVAIDNTISDPDGTEIRELLSDPVVAKAIEDGKLNVVFYRSAQKFDMAGFDNYNGGITASFNKSEAFGDFMNGMRSTGDEGDKISSFNLQGLTYLQSTARSELSAYRNGIVANTRMMLDPQSETNRPGFATDSFLRPDTVGQRFFQVTPNSDRGAVFVDLRSAFIDPDNPKAEDGYSSLFNLINKYVVLPGKDMPLQGRASFGFAHANISTIGGDRFRFNPGLESKETMIAYREMFDTINDAMSLADYPDPAGGDISATAIKLLSALDFNPALLDILGKAGRGEALDFNETRAAVAGLAQSGVHDLANRLLQRFDGQNQLLNHEQIQLREELGRTVKPSPSGVTRATFNDHAIGLRDALMKPDLGKFEARALLSTLTGQAMALDLDAAREIMARVANGLENLSHGTLEKIGGHLEELAKSFPDGDVRKQVANNLGERVNSLIEARASTTGLPTGTPATRMEGHFTALMIDTGSEGGVTHGFGLLQTEMNQMIGGETGVLAEIDRKDTSFGRLAAAMRPALSAIGTNQAALASPGVATALDRFARDHHGEILGLSPNSGATLSLVNFLPQGFVRNMQFGLAEMFRTATKPPRDEQDAQSQRTTIANQAIELQQKTVSAASNLKILATVVMHPDFLDLVPSEDRPAVEQFGASLATTLSEITRGPDNLLVAVTGFAQDVSQNPEAFLARF
ncbi:hypothetical protein [Anianabacter salinae]|uniref:hypothetical protein n=1 Tax=Anianabacter salinae TaxID=2851023 RepID=UPI00225E36E6|nr:hypothetical protein [Anianabacter salinae]